MTRVAGVNLPKEKRFVIALTYIHGIGNSTAERICKKLKIDRSLRTSQIDENVVSKVRSLIEADGLVLEGDLKER